jgi:hypothetical protein
LRYDNVVLQEDPLKNERETENLFR